MPLTTITGALEMLYSTCFILDEPMMERLGRGEEERISNKVPGKKRSREFGNEKVGF